MSIFPLYVLSLSMIVLGCSNGATKKSIASDLEIEKKDKEYSVSSFETYNFDNPTETMVLGINLREISSLSYDSQNNALLANDDESGFFYILNKEDGQTISKIKCGKRGDYEGIETVGDMIVMTKSNGTLYFYNRLSGSTDIVKTSFAAHNDVEGLCYDSLRNILLMACKGQPLGKSSKKKKEKCIYTYSLADNELDENPFIVITDDQLTEFTERTFNSSSKYSLKKLLKKVKDFSPSGIAIHPSTSDYYILSARSSLIIILNPKKEVKHIAFLNSKTIPQPEGITFDNNGDLYIATEGQGFSGKIFKFSNESIN